LPSEVQGDKLEGTFKNGLLDIRLPKFDTAQSKRPKSKAEPEKHNFPSLGFSTKFFRSLESVERAFSARFQSTRADQPAKRARRQNGNS